jgi:tetratricopeptide (TPR) repeat protein
LTALQQADLIREAARIPELEYAFRHALTQEATYRTILRKLRRDYHRRVGEVIEQLFPDQLEEHAPMLARHFLEAQDQKRALRYYTMAGDVAYRLYSLSAAVDHYSQAISLLDPLTAETGQLVHLYGRRGRALEIDDAFEEAMENYAEMEQLAAERQDEALKLAALQARTIVHAIFSPLFDPQKALLLAEEALTLAHQQADHAVEAKVLWSLMLVHGYGYSDMETAIGYGQQSLKLARQHDLKEQLPFILNDLGRVMGFQGQITASLPLIAEARALFEQTGNLALLQDNLGGYAMVAHFGGDLTGALEAAEEGLRVSKSINNVWGMNSNVSFINKIRVELGWLGQAVSELAELLESSEGDAILVWIDLAPLYSELGATALSLPLMTKLVDYFDSSGPIFKTMFRARLIRAYILEDDIEAAQRVTEDMQLDTDLEPIPPMYVTGFFALIELALAQGRLDEALVLSQRLNQQIEEASMTLYRAEGLMLEANGLMALEPPQPKLARTALEEASRISGQIGQKRVLWKAYLALAELSEEQEAAELRQKAREIVDWIAAGVDDPELRQSFLQQPLVRPVSVIETQIEND